MKQFKGNASRALSILFAIALIVTSIPQNVLQVSAAQDGAGDEFIMETPKDAENGIIADEGATSGGGKTAR